MLAHMNGYEGGNGNDQDQELRFRAQLRGSFAFLGRAIPAPASPPPDANGRLRRIGAHRERRSTRWGPSRGKGRSATTTAFRMHRPRSPPDSPHTSTNTGTTAAKNNRTPTVVQPAHRQRAGDVGSVALVDTVSAGHNDVRETAQQVDSACRLDRRVPLKDRRRARIQQHGEQSERLRTRRSDACRSGTRQEDCQGCREHSQAVQDSPATRPHRPYASRTTACTGTKSPRTEPLHGRRAQPRPHRTPRRCRARVIASGTRRSACTATMVT